MKAKKVVSKKKNVALVDIDHDQYDPTKLPDLRVTERTKALNKMIDTIESRGVVSSSDIRMLGSDNLTSIIRSDRFIEKLGKLINRTTKRKYYVDDDTQPKVEDFAYIAIRELAWRTAENVGLEKTKELVDDAMEALEINFSETNNL